MTPKQQRLVVDAMVQERMKAERRLWIDRCIMALTASYAADLMAKWDWKAEEVNLLIEAATKHFEAMMEGYVTVDDYLEEVREKGIKI